MNGTNKIAAILAEFTRLHYLHQSTLPIRVKRSPNGSTTAHIEISNLYSLRISDHLNPNLNHKFDADLVITDDSDIDQCARELMETCNVIV